MTITLIFRYILPWSLIGAVIFSLIVVYLFRSGKVYDARTEKGQLKHRISLKGLLSMLIFLGLIAAFLVFANIFSLIRQGIELSFWSLFCLNLVLILILILFDTYVIDWYVIGHWRPEFLRLPDAMDREQMKEHIRRTFYVAPIVAVIIAVMSSVVTTLIWN